jgi:hypothetical protein
MFKKDRGNFSGFYSMLFAKHEKQCKKGCKMGEKRPTVNNPIVALSFCGPTCLFPLYILAVVVVFVKISLDVLIYSPYCAIIYLSDAFYPAYIFFGVVCITGGLLGLVGHITGNDVVYMITPLPSILSVGSKKEKPSRLQ